MCKKAMGQRIEVSKHVLMYPNTILSQKKISLWTTFFTTLSQKLTWKCQIKAVQLLATHGNTLGIKCVFANF